MSLGACSSGAHLGLGSMDCNQIGKYDRSSWPYVQHGAGNDVGIVISALPLLPFVRRGYAVIDLSF